MTATLRELMKKRADLVSRASVLSETAEGEDREMNENEVAEFEAILGNGDAAGSVGVLDAQIAKIEDQRARLKAALEKIPAQVTEKPEATVLAAPSALKRAAFNALHPSEQAAYAKRGGKIED